MRTIRWVVCFLVIFAAIGTRIESHNSINSIASSIHAQGLAFKTSDHSLVDFISYTFNKLAQLSGDKRIIKVNQPYDRLAINILLFDFSKIDGGPIPTTTTGLYSVQPNVIVVDTGFVTPLLLNAFNDSSSFIQMLSQINDDIEKGKSVGSNEVISPETWGALALHLRLRNLTFKRELQTYGELIAQEIDGKPFVEPLSLAFSYPFAHELYHIRSNAPWGMHYKYFAEREERNADLFAKKVIRQRIDQSSKNTNGEILDSELVHLGLHYFQDIVVSELLKDFRGLAAEDYVVVLFHRPCEIANKVPWPKRFHNPDVVFEGAFRGFPMMTDAEYSAAETKLKRFQTETHENLLGRILRMREVFSDDENWAPIAEHSFLLAEGLYRAYSQGQGAAALIPKSAELPDTGNKSLHKLLEQLKPFGEWEQGSGCEHGACGVIRFHQGYLEVFAKGDLIQTLRLVEPSLKKDNSVAQTVISYFFGFEIASQFKSKITEQVRECRLATFSYKEPAYLLLAHVLNESGLIETEIVAH